MFQKTRSLTILFSLLSVCCVLGCTPNTTGSGTPATTSSPQLSISGTASNVLLGKTVQYAASGGTASSWTVNGIAGGNGTYGTVNASGLYTAPGVLPANASVTIGATTSSSQSATASLTLTSDVSVKLTSSGSSTPVLTQSTLNLTASISSAGSPSTGITWAVAGVVNGNSSVGTIVAGANGSAVYTAPSAQPTAPVQITATSVADTSKSASVSQTVQGILLATNTGTPGQTVTVNGHFDPTKSVNFTFSDGGTYSVTLPVTPSSATSASVLLPIYSTGGGVGVAGVLTVSAQQGSGSTTLIGSAPNFSLGALPAVSSSPGEVTTAVFTALSSSAGRAQHMWQVEAAASKRAITSSTLDAPLNDFQAQTHSLLAQLPGIATTPIQAGTIGNTTLTLDSTQLALLDRILQAYVVNNSQVQSALTNAAAMRSPGLTNLVKASANQQVSSFSSTNMAISAISPRGWLSVASILSAPGMTSGAGLYAFAAATNGYAQIVTYNKGHAIDTGTSTTDGSQPGDQTTSLFTAFAGDGVVHLASGVYSFVATDAGAAEAAMDPTVAASLYSQASVNNLTILENLPLPPTASSITGTPDGTAIPSTGGSIVDVTIQGLPDTSYVLTTGWSSDSYGVTTDDFGYAQIPVNVPSSGSTGCYSGTFTLAAADGSTSVSVSGCYAVGPVITTVSGMTASQSQTITITGSGFGTHVPYAGSSPIFSVQDLTAPFQAGYGFDSVGANITSWTDNQIVVQGFTGAYGGFYQFQTGDEILLSIWNAESGNGPGRCLFFVGSGAVACN
jgi:hypothetical protein